MKPHRIISLLLASCFACFASAVNALLPAAIDAPGEVDIAIFHAEGAQIYECRADAEGKLVWQFREPVATLISNGVTVGRHYAGPAWELTDGSAVTGKVISRAPGATANDIPWLKLSVVSGRGNGKLSGATTIQRVDTKGGLKAGPCEKTGELSSVPYSADYRFLKKS